MLAHSSQQSWLALTSANHVYVTNKIVFEIHPTYCGKFVEGNLIRLTQVKQFNGNATKY